MQHEKILNKHCFIRKKSNRRAYCSKCGKIVYQDEYNLKRHAKECGFHENDFVRIYDENQDFAAAFRTYNGYATFFVFTPVLELRPGFQDRYSGGKWKEVYRCTFLVKRKQTIERGLQNLAYWISYFEEHELALLNEKPLYAMMSESLFLPGIQNLSMFVKIFKGRGFTTESDLEKDYVRTLLAEEVPFVSEEEKPFDVYWGMQGRIDGYVFHGKDKTKPILKLQLSLYKENRTYQMILTEKCFYADGELDMKTLFGYRYYCSINEIELEYFDQCYPSFGVMNYLKAGGRNLLIPLFAAKYDVPLEMLVSNGCVVLADNYYQFMSNSDFVDPNGRKLKDLFGTTASVLRKLDESCKEIDNLFGNLHMISLSAPKYLKVEQLTVCNLKFLIQNEVISQTNRRRAVRGYQKFSKKEKLQIVRYLGNKRYQSEYQLYIDYLNMCYANENYLYGYTPDFLELAHNEAMNLSRYRKNSAQEILFESRVSEEDYLCLTSKYGEEAEVFSEEEFVVLAPKKSYDLVKESTELHHCVRFYIDDVIRGSSQIYFLRKKEEEMKPYATIEVKNNTVVQVKAACNAKVNESAKQFVCKWAKIKHLRIRTTDLD